MDAIEKMGGKASQESLSFALQQLNHMIIVEELFKSRLIGMPTLHNNTNTQVVPPFNSLKKRLLASGSWYLDFVLNCKDSNQKISFVFTDGKQGTMAISEILFHIVNHGTYHRGNIAHALDLAGVTHPLDGFGAFLHEFEPDRRKT